MNFKIEKIEIRNIGEKALMSRNEHVEILLNYGRNFELFRHPIISVAGYLYVKVEKYLYTIEKKHFSTEMVARIRFEMIMIEKENDWIPVSIDAVHNPGKKFEHEYEQDNIDKTVRTQILGEKNEEDMKVLFIHFLLDKELEQIYKNKFKEKYEQVVAFNEYQKKQLFDPIMKELNSKETDKIKEELF